MDFSLRTPTSSLVSHLLSFLNMKLISWNVNGIRAVVKKDLFMPFIERYDPDILCLQETKAEQSQSPVDLPQYEEYWNSAIKKGYSGTAIFSKIKPLRVITAEFKDFYVVAVYTPNAKDDLSRIPLRHKSWDPAFLAYCKELEKNGLASSPHGKPVIFCGDLNVAHTADDLARPKENEGLKGFTKEEREGFQNFIDAGFVDTFRLFHKGNGHYSRWSHFANARARNVGWRIDYFLVSASLKNKIKSAEILPNVMGSDHCPVLLEI